ncbi:uncharacterized protein LOC130449980 isoform X2 [Diorhabda sublineata]|uniref:uncharacterized protein LOC130449980 isoform X2 n=1 Tax=Diorhabda sublineata TaxID=1163346 RepID=UPI0024E0E66B|nr:uncharacterized protein LOC130449980 isoform X2 [Diorhabda sublineata]
MADALNFVINKQPYKIIEVPLAKFTEDVIPHHQNVYQQYKSSIKKLLALNNYEQLEKEIKEKKRNVKQLRNLMYELDTLRTQVEDEDLDKFDMETLSLRKIILNLITGYTELEKTVNQVIERQNVELEKENLEPFEGTSQIQMQQTIEEIKLKQREEQLNKVENIHKDVQDLNDIYKNLNEMVVNQADVVNQISNDVDNTQQNVIEGTRTLAKAHNYRGFFRWHDWWPHWSRSGSKGRRSGGGSLRNSWLHWW